MPGLSLGDRKFHVFGNAETYAVLSDHIGSAINTGLIIECWDDLLHIATSRSMMFCFACCPDRSQYKCASSGRMFREPWRRAGIEDPHLDLAER